MSTIVSCAAELVEVDLVDRDGGGGALDLGERRERRERPLAHAVGEARRFEDAEDVREVREMPSSSASTIGPRRG